MSRRAYRLGKRATAAQSTRDDILRAGRALATTGGFAGLTIEAVATQAGVSRLTVYNHFESKRGLLEALAWSIFASAEIERVREARMHPDVGVALRGFVSRNAEFLATLGAQGRAVLAAALADADLRAVVDATYVAGRRAAVNELVERLEGSRRLAPRWTHEQAVASLMVLTSLESFETLTVHSGWATSAAGDLLARMAAAILDASP